MKQSTYTRPDKPRRMIVKSRKEVERLTVEKIEVPTVDRQTECFTTPLSIIDLMISYAQFDVRRPHYIETILEPSAGTGSIADHLLNIEGVSVDCIEINSTLQDILIKKGHKIIADNFMSWDQNHEIKYDCIMMNPPFSNLQDRLHVMKAYNHLTEGGILVAIMSPRPFFGSCKRSTTFREWLDSVGGYSEDLPHGSFSNSGTQANSKLVVIEKEGK